MLIEWCPWRFTNWFSFSMGLTIGTCEPSMQPTTQGIPAMSWNLLTSERLSFGKQTTSSYKWSLIASTTRWTDLDTVDLCIPCASAITLKLLPVDKYRSATRICSSEDRAWFRFVGCRIYDPIRWSMRDISSSDKRKRCIGWMRCIRYTIGSKIYARTKSPRPVTDVVDCKRFVITQWMTKHSAAVRDSCLLTDLWKYH